MRVVPGRGAMISPLSLAVSASPNKLLCSVFVRRCRVWLQAAEIKHAQQSAEEAQITVGTVRTHAALVVMRMRRGV